jgi:hypothetical protein
MTTEHRAGQLASLARLEHLSLPAAARTAIDGYRALRALPVPPQPLPGADRRAITALADELARDALTGKHPAVPSLPLDVTAIAAARQAEQDSQDRANLTGDLRAAAAAVLCQVFYSESQQVIAAIQARHAEVMAELVQHARQVPEGTDDNVALEHGGELRVSYLAARDLVPIVTRLREAVHLVEDRLPPAPSDGIDWCLLFERTGLLAKTWLAPSMVTEHGALGSFEFYVSACKVPDYEWWCPAAGEVEERAEQLHQQMHASRVAELPAMPPRLRATSVF